MKYDMNDGCWWGLIKNSMLIAVIWRRIGSHDPNIFDFDCSFTISSENQYNIIPVNIREVGQS